MRWFAVDSETNILNRGDEAVGTMQAHPAHALNKIVSLGEQWHAQGKPVYAAYYSADGVEQIPTFLQHAMEGKDTLLVIHNVPFDFSYILKTWPDEVMEALPHLYVWDTMQVAYLLSGQEKVMPSLDKESEELGLPLKDDRIKQYWKDGVDTSMIPKELLLEYMEQDVDNTRQIFLDQWNAVQQSPKLLELVRIKMDDKLFTTFMQVYGMHFNVTKAAELLEVVETDAKTLHAEIMEEAKQHFAEDFTFNPGSPDQVSTLLFGGTYKVERQETVFQDGEPVIYKSGQKKGQVKTRKVKVEVETKGLGLPTKGIPANSYGYSTSDDHLSKLNHPLPAKLLAYRGLTKDASVYYRGYSELVWPDGCIRPNINHEIAATGRQSSSAPNLQNVSKEDEE